MSPSIIGRARPQPYLLGFYPQGESFNQQGAWLDATRHYGFYSRFRPFTAPINVSGTGFWSVSATTSIGTTAQLHNRFFYASPSATNALGTFARVGPATCTSVGASTAGAVTGFVWRDYLATDVDLSGSFRFIGTPTNLSAAQPAFAYSLAARITGTPDASNSATSNITSCNGYLFAVMGNNTNAQRVFYLLLRLAAGTPAVLAQSQIANLAGLFPSNSNTAKELRFTCRTVGADVELVGYTKDAGGAWQSVLTYTDVGAAATYPSGRCGIMVSGENSSTAPFGQSYNALQCNWWELKTYAGTLVLREFWERLNNRGGVTAPLPSGFNFPHSLTGGSLLSGWVGDLATYENSTQAYYRSLLVDSANNRAQLRPNLTSTRVYNLSQRIADNAQAQDRQVDFVFGTSPGSGTTAKTGIILLATPNLSTVASYQSTPSAGPSGYLAEVQASNVGGTIIWSIGLYRLAASSDPNSGTLLAATGALATLAVNVPFTLRFSAVVSQAPAPGIGYPLLRVYLNGTQLTWTQPAGSYSGFDIAADGTVRDTTSPGPGGRISFGMGEGLSCYVTNQSWLLYADGWVQVTASGEQEQDQATIATPAEDDNASGTFSVPYSWGFVEDAEWRVIDHSLDRDYRYSAPLQERPRRRWSIGNDTATAAEVSTLEAFWASQKGAEVPFNWTTLDGESVTVRFAMDSLSVERKTAAVFAWTAQLEEVMPE